MVDLDKRKSWEVSMIQLVRKWLHGQLFLKGGWMKRKVSIHSLNANATSTHSARSAVQRALLHLISSHPLCHHCHCH